MEEFNQIDVDIKNIKLQSALKKISEAAIRNKDLNEFYKEINSVISALFSNLGFLLIVNEKKKQKVPILIDPDNIYTKYRHDFFNIHKNIINCKKDNFIEKTQFIKEECKIDVTRNGKKLHIIAVPLINKIGENIGSFFSFSYNFGYVYDKVDKESFEMAATNVSMGIERLLTESELKESYDKLLMAKEALVFILANALEIRDPYTAGHQRRVCELACEIAKKLRLEDESFLQRIRLAATIHDIGKIYVPSEILTKPGKLKTLEKEIIYLHPEVGFNLLNKEGFLTDIAKIVYQHHERIDGSGYPNGIKGEEICMEAKVIAVADTVEAMNSFRPYREALGIFAAIDEIKKNAGKIYDEEIVKICVELIEEEGFLFS